MTEHQIDIEELIAAADDDLADVNMSAITEALNSDGYREQQADGCQLRDVGPLFQG